MEFKGFTDQQLEELIKEQKALDDEIRKNNGISETESLVSKKYIALKTELYELVNQIESFKYWKKHKGKDNILEEGVDMLHFILSLAIETGIDLKHEDQVSVKEFFEKTESELEEHGKDFIINESTIIMDTLLTEIPTEKQNIVLYPVLIILLQVLQICGYTIEDIYNCYMKKNEINHERQENNY